MQQSRLLKTCFTEGSVELDANETNNFEETKARTLYVLHLIAQDSDLSDDEGGMYSKKK